MVATSYDGETQDGVCPSGHVQEIASHDFQELKQDSYEGFCTDCGKSVKFAPVEAVGTSEDMEQS